MKPYPGILKVVWIGGNKVRVWFSTGRVTEIALPVKSAHKAHVVVKGMGLDPGDGMEISATRLYGMRGRVIKRATQTRV